MKPPEEVKNEYRIILDVIADIPNSIYGLRKEHPIETEIRHYIDNKILTALLEKNQNETT